MDVTQLVGQIDDESLMEHLKTCQRFQVDSQLEGGKDTVFIFAMETLNAHTLKPDTVFDMLEWAAELNAASVFMLKKMENGTNRQGYAHEKNTLMEQSKHVATKKVLVKVRNVLSISSVNGACANERANTKWNF